ncbi:putative signal transduction protein with EAL and GGDEF domain [Metabacillus crassostreae]|nr:GGDEF domain-containing protein [Metabacillus crassostreae]MBM7602977.1 putative signal transduction protein with EAL and GGDEF domain [Metabacillus crassostreae]
MKVNIDTLANIKKTIYFYSSIFILIYIIGNLFLLENSIVTDTLSIFLIIYFIASLFLLKHAVFVRFHEIMNLVFISIYLFEEFFENISVDFLNNNSQSLGDFIIWMPIYIIYLFLVLGKKFGLIVSSFVLVVNLLIGLPYFTDLTGQQLDSVIRYYIANLIYILVIYSFQYIVSIHAEYQALKKNAYYDDLTEIPNRRKSTAVFNEMIEVTNKKNTSFSVLFIDIDHFKVINDNFGHDVGDIILKEFAALIAQKLSKEEFLGRWVEKSLLLLHLSPYKIQLIMQIIFVAL